VRQEFTGVDVSYVDGGCRNLRNVGALLPEYTVSRLRKVSVYCTWKYAILVSRVMRKVSVRGGKKRLDFNVLNAVAILCLISVRYVIGGM
jgi:hypothetical protein